MRLRLVTHAPLGGAGIRVTNQRAVTNKLLRVEPLITWGAGLWGLDPTKQRNYAGGGYVLQSSGAEGRPVCQVKIFEPDGWYAISGICLEPGTPFAGFTSDSRFNIDFQTGMDIIATPHSFVLFSPPDEHRGYSNSHADHVNIMIGTVDVPTDGGWAPGLHVFVLVRHSVVEWEFRQSTRPSSSLVSFNGAAWVWGDFGVYGPPYGH